MRSISPLSVESEHIHNNQDEFNMFRAFRLSCFRDELSFSFLYFHPLLARMAAFSSLPFFGGAEKSGLLTMVIASSGQPVAHTAHPKQRSKSTTGTSSSPMESASGGHRSIQVSQATQSSALKRGSKPELKYIPGLDLAKAFFTATQCHRSQFQRKPMSSVVFWLM